MNFYENSASCPTEDLDNDMNVLQRRGTLTQEYEIYVSCSESLNLDVKSFDEWLNS